MRLIYTWREIEFLNEYFKKYSKTLGEKDFIEK